MSFLPHAPSDRVWPLTRRILTTLDANGSAEERIGPSGGRRWSVSFLSVQGESGVDPLVKVYLDQAALGNFIDGTTTGNQDSGSYLPALVIDAGQELVFTWEGGTAMARVAALISGSEEGVA